MQQWGRDLQTVLLFYYRENKTMQARDLEMGFHSVLEKCVEGFYELLEQKHAKEMGSQIEQYR